MNKDDDWRDANMEVVTYKPIYIDPFEAYESYKDCMIRHYGWDRDDEDFMSCEEFKKNNYEKVG